MQGYVESYDYDSAGNLAGLMHMSAGAFSETFSLVPQTDLLQALNLGGSTSYQYAYDANGNLIQENTERHLEWDHSDRLRVFRIQPDGAEPSIHAQYFYDMSGQRAKKVIRKQGGALEVTV